MYILLVSRGVPTVEEPQFGCFEQDQAEALQRFGHKVVVVCVDSRFRMRWRKIGVTHENKNGVDYYNSFWISGAITDLLGKTFSRFIKELQLIRIYKKVEEVYGKPDLIYSHYLFNSFLALTLKKKYNIPIVAIEHWSEVNKDTLKSDVRFMGDCVFQNVNKVIAVSNSLRLMLKRHFNVDSEIVHNIVGNGFGYKPITKNKEYFNFVSVGSLLYVKGYDVLIEAFAKIANEINAKLSIVGAGNQYNYLMELIRKYNLQNQVSLLGRKNRTEIASILACSDVYVSSSRSENFSVSVLEALSVGLPVVATICGGIRECINNDNGILVPVENSSELGNAMLQIYNNIHLYNREYIANDFEDRFSTNTIIGKLENIFKSVVKQ